ncbi:WD40 domain-containing protein, partial [Salmonella enterica subsp. enterica serovar Typhimurium]|nr:WD40 domain-containing protein [Salmonella enterica subsp. enterica serovar Typhimurium]
GAELSAIEAHSATVSGLAFAAGGRELASVSLDGSWKLWRLIREAASDDAPPRARLEQARLLRNPGQGQLRCTAYSPDG